MLPFLAKSYGMESIFALISIIVGVWMIGTPILALIAFSRTSRLKEELPKIRESQKLLSEQVSRLQARLQRVQTEFEGLKPTERVEQTEAEAEPSVPASPLEVTYLTTEPQAPGPFDAEEAPAVEAEVADTADLQQEPAGEEPSERPAAVAARIESPWESVAKSPAEPSDETEWEQEKVEEEQEAEAETAEEQEEIAATPEAEELPREPSARPTPIAARVSSARGGDLETRLSTNWLVWIGGISLAIAGIFLVRYIAEQGWLSPALRCAIGVVFGLALIIAGEFVRRRPLDRSIASVKPDYVPQALTAAGLVTAFGSIYLAYAFYDLIPSGSSFALLAGITMAAFALSIIQGKFVALLGLAGAIATPALVSTADPSAWGFFTYLGIVILATLAVADRKLWFWLPELSLVAAAGWTALWLSQPFREADALPIGVTLGFVAIAAFGLAWRAGPASAPKSDGKIFAVMIAADEVAGSGFLLALGSAFALAIFSDFSPTVHWLFLTFAVVATVVVRLLPRFDWTMVALTVISVVAFGLVYVDENTLANLSERLLGIPVPTEYFVEKYQNYLLHGTLIAFMLFAGGLQSLGSAMRPQAVATLTGAAPLALLLIGYAQFRGFSGDAIWVWAATGTVATSIVATILAGRRKKEVVDLPAIYAAFAVIAAFLALTFQFDRIWLTLSYAALVLVLGVISVRSDFPTVRTLVNMIVLIVVARLTVNPDLRGYEIFHPLGMQWVTYGYLVPLALFLAAGHMFKRAKDDLTVTVLEGAALLLATVFISIEIRIFMTGSIYSGEYRLPEASLQTIAWLTSALVLARRNLRYPRLFSTWGARILTAAGAFQATTLQLIIMNPVYTGEFIDGYGLFNMLILSLAAPAVLLWLIAGSLIPKDERHGDAALKVLRGAAAVLAFAFVTEEVRVFFQGMLIKPEHASLLELYVTTLVWLIPASLPYLVSSTRSSHHLRSLATIIIVVAMLMLVFGHALNFNPVVSGELVRGWPAINTLLIGFLLPAAVLYLVAKHINQPMRMAALAAAYLLVLVWVWLSFKHAFQGARLTVFHETLLELYLTTLAWLLLGSTPLLNRRIGNMAEAKRAGYAFLAVSLAMLFVGHTLIFNPVFDMMFVPGWPVLNVLLLGFIVPAALLAFIARKLDQKLHTIFMAAAYVLFFVGITMLVKHAFQGGVLTHETLTDIENYGYSAAWLVLAVATMIAGIMADKSNVRYASLAVLLLVVLKVFLLDMSNLAGLWRVASFFGLGISLVGIGFVYQQFMYRKQNAEKAPTSLTQEA